MSRFSVRDDLRSEDQVFDGDRQIELSEAVDLLNAAYPTSYTPREEVTEGWWSCVRSCSRTLVRVGRNFHGSLQVSVVNCDVPLPLEWFTDFLPVPEWLVEGIKSDE